MPLIIPLGELERDRKLAIRKGTEIALRRKAVELGIAPSDADIVVRDVSPGDPTDANVTDFKDIEPLTAQTAGMEFWAEDAGDITANDLSQVFRGEATGSAVPNKKVIGIFGFYDLSSVPDLVAIRFRRGSDTLDFWEVEQCYAYPNEIGGMIDGAVVFEENDPQRIEMNFKSAADRYVGLHAYIAERYAEQISKSPG